MKKNKVIKSRNNEVKFCLGKCRNVEYLVQIFTSTSQILTFILVHQELADQNQLNMQQNFSKYFCVAGLLFSQPTLNNFWENILTFLSLGSDCHIFEMVQINWDLSCTFVAINKIFTCQDLLKTRDSTRDYMIFLAKIKCGNIRSKNKILIEVTYVLWFSKYYTTYIYIIQHLVQSWPGPPGQLWTYSSELYIGRYIYLLKMYTYLSKTKG